MKCLFTLKLLVIRRSEMLILVQVLVNVLMSLGGFFVTLKAIPKTKQLFIKANLYGIDRCKNNKDKKV